VLTRSYLPDWHDFAHIAIVPWPDYQAMQQDWIYNIDIMEDWLDRTCGSRYVNWAWATTQEQQYWQACIAFREAKFKTLCLLTWGR
jgi:hypothetical protein